MAKPKLCEVLGVELMEEFQYNDSERFYKVNEQGHIEERKKDSCVWNDMGHQYLLENMIELGVIGCFDINDAKFNGLQALKDVFGAETLHKDIGGLYIKSSRDSDLFVRLPKKSCLTDLFVGNRDCIIYIDDFLKRRKND